MDVHTAIARTRQAVEELNQKMDQVVELNRQTDAKIVQLSMIYEQLSGLLTRVAAPSLVEGAALAGAKVMKHARSADDQA